MPAIAGRKSTFEVSTDGNTFVHVDGLVDISFSYNVSEIECTKHSIGLSDAGRREYLPNLEDRTFDVSCRWLDGDPGQDIILDAASTNPKTIFYYRFKMDTVTNIPFIGRAFATSISPTGPLDDTAGVDFTLRCTTLGLPEPALDLQFAETLSLTDQASGNNLIAFTRATSATYVGSDGLIKTAASGEARFDHDPITRESLGLLIEETRTNRILYSQNFSDANWTKTNTSVTGASQISPDGTNNGFLFAGDGAIADHSFRQFEVLNQTKTSSIYAKKGTLNFLQIAFDGYLGYANFNLDTGVVSAASGGATATITPAGNGWYRCACTANTTTATTTRYGLISSGSSGRIESWATSGNIYVWGAQIEEGAFPTSYIPTAGAAATRNVDSVLIDGANFSSWYNQNEGSFLAEYQRPFDADAVGYQNPRVFAVSQGSALNNRIAMFSYTSGASNSESYVITTAGLTTAFIEHPPVIGANESARLSMSYSATLSQASSCRDGGSAINDTSAAIYTSMDRFRLGNNATAPSSGLDVHNGTIKSLTYYNERIPNAALQELTVK